VVVFVLIIFVPFLWGRSPTLRPIGQFSARTSWAEPAP
jgi:hypothetical protein